MISGDRIADVGRVKDAPRGTKVIDAKNLYLVPGYIDLHIHGGGGASVMEGTREAIATLCRAHALEGTTTVLPTTTAAPLSEIERAIQAIEDAQRSQTDATIAGVHLQGPFLSPAYMKKQAIPHLLSPSDLDWQALLKGWQGVRMVGLAPELPGALAFSDALRDRGIVASISHSNASYDQVLNAVSHGFSDVSNIYSGCSSLMETPHGRVPGVTECALTMDELSVQLVADGKKLPMMLMQIVLRCKGPESILLVSDAGAGSQTSMALLVRNMVAAGAPLRVALRMATVNPARRIGLNDTKGRIAPGYDADILLLDETLSVRFCMARGSILRDELDSM
ncbi:amidohydrolase family protein [Eubacteriales bacterium OttesenSCG-928-A19]|nr:amidohydrolase family protein [Eubacteriales bacterium OttesenSCG-928-A19]